MARENNDVKNKMKYRRPNRNIITMNEGGCL